ncbi:MAG TPA: acyl carrier protein [Firmicutes bacterium]|nr:acyl carrier protein [Bacillota bacterium]
MPDKVRAVTLESVGKAIMRAASPLEITPALADEDLQELGMDSLDYVAVVVELEKTFAIRVPEDGMLFSRMNTLRKITEMVRGAAGDAGAPKGEGEACPQERGNGRQWVF